MKSKWIIGLVIMCVLAISAGAQQNGGAQPSEGAIISVPQQQSNGTASPPTRLEPPGGAPAAESYPEQLESVLAAMSAELAEIAQAVHRNSGLLKSIESKIELIAIGNRGQQITD